MASIERLTELLLAHSLIPASSTDERSFQLVLNVLLSQKIFSCISLTASINNFQERIWNLTVLSFSLPFVDDDINRPEEPISGFADLEGARGQSGTT